MDEIIRMQEYLLLIRRTVGWTAEEFGEKSASPDRLLITSKVVAIS